MFRNPKHKKNSASRHHKSTSWSKHVHNHATISGMFNNRTGPEKMKKKWKFRNRTGPDRTGASTWKCVKIWPNLMKMGQHMTIFYENQWFGDEKYDFGVIKMIPVVKKHVFMMILGSKIQLCKKIKNGKNEKLKKKWNFIFFKTLFLTRNLIPMVLGPKKHQNEEK